MPGEVFRGEFRTYSRLITVNKILGSAATLAMIYTAYHEQNIGIMLESALPAGVAIANHVNMSDHQNDILKGEFPPLDKES